MGWVWSSPHVLKGKFFPFFLFVFQAWSNLQRAAQRHKVHLWQGQRAHSETEDRPAEPKPPQRDPRNGFLPLHPRALPPRLQPLRPNKGRCPRSVPLPRPRACINVRPSESSLTSRAKPGSVTSGGEGSEETVTEAPTGFSQNRTKPHKD